MERDVETETPETRNLSRRQVLGFIGATAAASLVGAKGEQALAEQMSAPTQNPKSRIVTVDAKPERLAMEEVRRGLVKYELTGPLGVPLELAVEPVL